MAAMNRILAARILALPLVLLAGCSGASQSAAPGVDEEGFQWLFEVDPTDWASSGRNDWFVLEPGYCLTLENERKTEQVVIRVLDETKLVDNVETRVVEERETAYGKLKEVSRNYFALSQRTKDVYYFGEDVDQYKNGVLDSHEGSWLAGVDGARFGLMLPAKPVPGALWYQELAADVALDRSQVKALDKGFAAPAGNFTGCLEVEETTPLDPAEKSKKLYAPGVGLVQDGSLRLMSYGKQADAR